MRIVVVLVLAGCLDAAKPEVGELAGPRCDNSDSDPGTLVPYSRIRAEILVDRGHCTKCHTPDGATPIGIQLASFDMSTYTSLRAGGRRSGTNIIVPGDPCASVLAGKISPTPPFAARMPYDGPPYLSDEDRQLVHDWIAEGALEN